MKKIILFATAVLLLYACSDKKDEPTPEPINDGTEYRLDSAFSYREDTLNNKLIYHYSKSNKYFDYTIRYTLNNNRWSPSTKDSREYDSKWNIIEEHSSSYNDGEWRKFWSLYCYDLNDKGLPAKQIEISFDSQEKEQFRIETQYKWDSLGNVILTIKENYTDGNLTSYNATKTDYYYSGNHIDSTYIYTKADPNDPYVCSGKSIPLDPGAISYTYQDNQFVLQSKNVMELDSHQNITRNEYYEWKDNNWVPRWYYTVSFKYLLDTDLIEETTALDVSYDKDGNIRWEQRTRNKNFYTKL